LIDLVDLRVSQINGCAYCIDMHSRDLLKLAETTRSVRLEPAHDTSLALDIGRSRLSVTSLDSRYVVPTYVRLEAHCPQPTTGRSIDDADSFAAFQIQSRNRKPFRTCFRSEN
jgi:AhpD family alkylhydroperoxidase